MKKGITFQVKRFTRAASVALAFAFSMSACSSIENTEKIETEPSDKQSTAMITTVGETTESETSATETTFTETKAAETTDSITSAETTAEITAETSAEIIVTSDVETEALTTTQEIVVTASAETTALPVGQESDEDWAVYVIGNNNPLPDNYVPQTKSIAGERLLDIRCADYAIQMLNDARNQGVGLFVTSSYRSIETQRINLENYTNRLINKGYSVEDATAKAQSEIALPGHSEHNAGLAMDIVSDDYWSYHSDLEQSFDQLPQYDWLIENSWKYGFILSYPKGKEDITGFIYEPWHYRFVGHKHAEKIHEIYESTGEFLTVNEYVEQYMN